jgi:hypothetical protein
MSAAAHRIGRVVFDVEAPDQAAVAAFGAAVRARFDAVIEPALEAALDRIDRPGALIRLDRVEIDLGPLSGAPADMEDLSRRIADGLAAALASAPPDETTGTDARDDVAELIAFLETGELPWSEPGGALMALSQALAALEAPAMARLAARLRTVLIRRRAAERLVRQLPATLVRRLLRALLPDALAAPLIAFGPDAPVPTDSPVPETLVPRLIQSLQALAKGSALPDLGEVVALFTALDSRMPAAAHEAFAPASPPDAPVARESGVPAFEQVPSGPGPVSESADEEPEARSLVALRPVHAAGAVLLHPFLGTFFTRVGLLAAPGKFHDPQARARAVLLAHHLATGAEDAPEPETVLFKILCGLEIADPVPRRIALTDTERTEAANLLDGVITHWGRLGKTSPAGLRDGFLTRMGGLQREAGLWRLTVERRGIDVLLDDLPWTLSRVKTPFMRSILTVDWR